MVPRKYYAEQPRYLCIYLNIRRSNHLVNVNRRRLDKTSFLVGSNKDAILILESEYLSKTVHGVPHSPQEPVNGVWGLAPSAEGVSP